MGTSPRSDSFLRIRCGERVKYVVVSPADGPSPVCHAAGGSKKLTANTFECVRKGQSVFSQLHIAKIAYFEWEIPNIERETHIYRLLQQTDITPRFLGHIHEEGRVIGFLPEKLDGVSAGIEHHSRCAEILGRLHQVELLHGDVNRYNFISGQSRTKMIDFEQCQKLQDRKLMESEILSLPSQLQDESGHGAGFPTDDEEED
ncbi:hypothetical protein Daus18300_003694 [Diaporthe australafricana]|uniref:Alpha-galactosidase A n=1 Tax=Diaporthe australafricana TaxID=127596 RepID=A0ABR3XEF8_9PEZI